MNIFTLTDLEQLSPASCLVFMSVLHCEPAWLWSYVKNPHQMFRLSIGVLFSHKLVGTEEGS